MIRALLVVILVLAGCAGPGPVEPSDWPLLEPARALPRVGQCIGEPGPGGGTVLQPASDLVSDGVAYRFELGHCGLFSPVDVDGAFCDAVEGTTAMGAPMDLATDPEAINQTAGVIAVRGDEARLRTEAGSILRFERHAGEKEFPGCD